jgi:CubicO group peptidase (beta-lactamase class C family)
LSGSIREARPFEFFRARDRRRFGGCIDPWLQFTTDYICDWLEFQFKGSQQPGCIFAIVYRDKVIAQHAFGHADLDTQERLTPRHRFRIASHSKSFTSAGVMKLREARKLRLDDTIGQYVMELHPQVAQTTIAQLLSHSAGLTRDGIDSGQFIDIRPYLAKKELLAELKQPTAIEPNTRFKYSNHGYGLLGLLIEAITGESYDVWIKREIVDAVGLRETVPNMPIAKGVAFGRGHSRLLPAGKRLVIPGDNPAHAMAAAAGFVSTATDTARFFGQLAPNAKRSVISGLKLQGNDAKTMAQSTCQPGDLLRTGDHERQHSRLGLVRPQRRFSRLYLADLRDTRLRGDHDQLDRRLGSVLG